MKTYEGKVEVRFTVEVPDGDSETACAHPVAEAVLGALSDHCAVFIFGEEQEPAHVYLDVQETDVEFSEVD